MIDPVYNAIVLHHGRLEVLENRPALKYAKDDLKQMPKEERIGVQCVSYNAEENEIEIELVHSVYENL